MTAAVRYHVGAPSRRPVTTAPAARPDLRVPLGRPASLPAPGRRASVASCAVASPEPRQRWLAVKVIAVSLLALAGGAVSVAQLASTGPDPAFEYVAGDPAWAHVAQP